MKFFHRAPRDPQTLQCETLVPLRPQRKLGLVAIGALIGALLTGGGTLVAARIDRAISYSHRLHDQHARDAMRIRQLETRQSYLVRNAHAIAARQRAAAIYAASLRIGQ